MGYHVGVRHWRFPFFGILISANTHTETPRFFHHPPVAISFDPTAAIRYMGEAQRGCCEPLLLAKG